MAARYVTIWLVTKRSGIAARFVVTLVTKRAVVMTKRAATNTHYSLEWVNNCWWGWQNRTAAEKCKRYSLLNPPVQVGGALWLKTRGQLYACRYYFHSASQLRLHGLTGWPRPIKRGSGTCALSLRQAAVCRNCRDSQCSRVTEQVRAHGAAL